LTRSTSYSSVCSVGSISQSAWKRRGAAEDVLGAGERPVVVEVLVEEVLLVELVPDGVVALQAREVAVVVEQAQADTVKGAEVNLVEVDPDAERQQAVGDAGGELGGGLLGEGDDEDGLGRGALDGDQVDDALDHGEGLPGPGAGDDQQRPLAVRDGPALRGVGGVRRERRCRGRGVHGGFRFAAVCVFPLCLAQGVRQVKRRCQGLDPAQLTRFGR
jgi:hypothetical protein